MTQALPQNAVAAKRSARFWVVAVMIAAAWLIAIGQLSLDWTINPQYQYGWIVPILTIVLWFQVAGERPSAEPPKTFALSTSIVVIVTLLAIPARIVQESNPDWRLLNAYFALQAIIITALVLYQTGGPRWIKHFGFPLLFPLVSLPWQSDIENALIQGMQHFVSIIGAEGASWIGWSAVARGNMIVLPTGTVGVNEACSGIRSLQTSLMIAIFMGQYLRLSWPRRFLLIGLSVLFAFSLNLCRAFILIALMASQGVTTMEKFHDPAGITISVGTLILLWLISNFIAPKTQIAPAQVNDPANQTLRAAPNPRLGFPLVYAAVLLGAWLTAEVVNHIWFSTIEAQTMVAAPIWTLKWPPVSTGFQTREIDESTTSILRYDEGKLGTWTNEFGWEVFFFTWNPGRASAGLAQAHHPDICMPAAGFVLKHTFDKETLSINGFQMPFTRYVFADPNTGESYYVFQCVTNDQIWRDSGTVTTAETFDPFQRFENAWEGRRNPGQRSLLIVNRGAQSIDQAEAAMKEMLRGCVESK